MTGAGNSRKLFVAVSNMPSLFGWLSTNHSRFCESMSRHVGYELLVGMEYSAVIVA